MMVLVQYTAAGTVAERNEGTAYIMSTSANKIEIFKIE